jgi:hypothetical protein
VVHQGGLLETDVRFAQSKRGDVQHMSGGKTGRDGLIIRPGE